MNSHFLSWFAGFMDGEGYFGILRNNNGKGYMCQVSIKLRGDDIHILNRIAKETKIGKVYKSLPSQTYKTKSGETHDQAKWQVADIDGCLSIIDIFDNYPLLGKKAGIYKMWRSAVLYMKENGNKRSSYVDDVYDNLINMKKYSTKK